MKYTFWILLFPFFLMKCGKPGSLENQDSHNIAHYFQEFAVPGTFVFRRGSTGETYIFNRERAKTRFLPASTFKIFSSLESLETGIIGIDDVIPWDGVERAYPAWNQDQRMREAFQRSTVWFYQILVRRIGEERMRDALRKNRYGNGATGGGIDRFWLSGELRISALEQVNFLERLKERKLAFSRETMDQVEGLMLIKECPGFRFRGKTGWTTTAEGSQLGWWIGWLERESETYFYAMNLESGSPDFPMVEARKKILFGILKEFGYDVDSCSRL